MNHGFINWALEINDQVGQRVNIAPFPSIKFSVSDTQVDLYILL